MNNLVDIRKLGVNPDNPRTLSEFMEGKLIESILVFPKMLEVRPIVVNKSNVVLGGNMRLKMLMRISTMKDNEIEDYLLNQKKYRQMPSEEQDALRKSWSDFREKPLVPCVVAKELSKDEELEFLVKDNIHYGEDNIDIMRQFYDRELISDYTGSIPWNIYDYSDKINDEQLSAHLIKSETFKCGYVQCQITKAELEGLNTLLDQYLAEHDGESIGFLTYLLEGNEKDCN